MEEIDLSIGGNYTLGVLLSGDRAADRVAVAAVLRHLANLVEQGDLDEELGAGQIG
jgi:hypothetical protein